MSEVPSASRARDLSSAGQLLGALAIPGAPVGRSPALSSSCSTGTRTCRRAPPRRSRRRASGRRTRGARYHGGDRARPGLYGADLHALLPAHRRGGGGGASLGNYLTPTFALFYGVILLGEPLTVAGILGLALIIIGAEITLRGDSAKRAGGMAKAHEYRSHPPLH
jgi:hypothetical protein